MKKQILEFYETAKILEDLTGQEFVQVYTCIDCGEEVEENEEYFTSEGESLCWGCYEYDEMHADTLVVFGEDIGDAIDVTDNGEYKYRIGTHVNDTQGEFYQHYVRLDGWRGYTELKSDDWTVIHEDQALAYSKDEQDLKQFHDDFKQMLQDLDIPYAIAYCATSNLFCMNVDFYVKNDDVDQVNKIIQKLKKLYRDPVAFMTTALTGADPEDQSDEDKFFALLASTLLSRDE